VVSDRGQCKKGRRGKVLKPWHLDAALLRQSNPDCIVMRRLPANHGEEITRDVLVAGQSIVLHHAEKKLHVQKGVVGYLFQHPIPAAQCVEGKILL
jgi:ornithine carbamoyltransferase